MVARKSQPKKEPVLIRSHALTVSTLATLNYLSRDATDYIGRGVSSSAVIRAMIQYVDQQDTLWIRKHLFSLIEEEMQRGTRWGKTKSE